MRRPLPLVLLLGLLGGRATADVPPDLAEELRWDPPIEGSFLGVRGEVGAGRFHITRVNPGCAAERAGLRPGDAVIALGGAEGFADFAAFAGTVASLEPGGPVTATVVREENTLELEIVPDHGAFRDHSTVVDRLRSSRFLGRLERTGPALDAIVGIDAPRLREVRRWSAAYEVLNDALGRLGVSHAAIVPPWTFENLFRAGATPEGSRRLGLLLAVVGEGGGRDADGNGESDGAEGDGDRVFVHHVVNGGPAEAAGLRRGDEVLEVNGVPARRSPRRVLAGYESRFPYFTLQVEPGEEVELLVRRERHGAAVRVAPHADRPVGELLASRESVRTIESSGRLLAYIHLWNLLSPELVEVVREALSAGESGGAEGWVVDLRGRGGSVVVLTRLARLLEDDLRPLVLLIDRDTRSAKEILAHRLRRRPRTRLVGESTAGAVLPAGYVRLSRGAMLMLPLDPRSIAEVMGDTVLEGIGVSPDVDVIAPLPYSGGADPILDRGIETLLELLAEIPRRRRF